NACVGIERIDRARAHIGRNDTLILGDWPHRVLVEGFRLDIETRPHRGLPGLASIRRAIDPARVLAADFPTGNRAVEDDETFFRVGAARKGAYFAFRQPGDLPRPGLAAVLRPPYPFARPGKTDALRGRTG